MKWPNHADYAEVIQFPEVSFDDPDLKHATPATNSLGLPIAMSGNFASVYQLSNASDTFAVRCFIRQVTNQKARYAGLEKYLSSLDLPFMVPFEFVSRGIRVNEDWYPIVKMDWVTGTSLHTYVEDKLEKPSEVELLSINWRELARTLEENDIGHGDLQHGNVLVTPGGQLKLVDYDGMFVPLFANEKSPELGHLNYQHPLRNPDFYDERLDRFSALLVYLSLKAISAEPELWREFHTGDNLLISAEDMRVPQSSKLWPRLLTSPDEEVQKLTVFFTDFLRVPPMNVPDLETILESSIRGIVVPKRLDFAGASEEEPLAKKAAATIDQAPTMPTGTASLPVKAFEIAGCSAIVLALLALAPPLRFMGGLGAMLLAVTSFVLPGKLTHYSRVFAVIALGLGLIRTTQNPQLEATARNTEPVPMSTSLAGAETATPNDGKTCEDQPPGQHYFPKPTRSQMGETISTNRPPERIEDQSISVPLSPPSEQPTIHPVVVWEAHRQAVSSMAFTGDGQHLITTAADRVLSIWSTLDQTLIHSISNLSEPIVSITTLTNAGIFATANRAANLEWWSMDGGIPLKQIRFSENSLFPPTISHDGRLIAIGSGDRRSLSLHRDGSPQIAGVISGFSSWVKHVHFSANNRHVAILTYDDSISLRDVGSGKILQTFTFPDADIQEIACSENGSWLVATGSNGRIRAWDAISGKLCANTTVKTSGIVFAEFSRDGRWIIAATGQGEIHCIYSSNGLVRTPKLEHQSPFTAIALSPDGQWVAVGNNRGDVTLWKTSQLLGDTVVRMARP